MDEKIEMEEDRIMSIFFRNKRNSSTSELLYNFEAEYDSIK